MWRDMTDFRDANDYFFFFFAVSVIVFGTLMFVAGSFVSGAFVAYTLFYGQGSGSAVSQSCKGE